MQIRVHVHVRICVNLPLKKWGDLCDPNTTPFQRLSAMEWSQHTFRLCVAVVCYNKCVYIKGVLLHAVLCQCFPLLLVVSVGRYMYKLLLCCCVLRRCVPPNAMVHVYTH